MKKKRNVLVTGSSSGIGLRITKAFAKKNYRVIACSRRKDLMEKELSDFKNIHIFSLDLSKPKKYREIYISYYQGFWFNRFSFIKFVLSHYLVFINE